MKKSKNFSRKVFRISMVSFSLLIIGWGVLTKAGYLPNFLNIQFLEIHKDWGDIFDDFWRYNNIIDINWNNPEENDYNPRDPDFFMDQVAFKPVIYLYPETEQKIKVQLDYQGDLFAVYPDYDPEIWWWEVIASPDSTLINLADNREYSYLFWEGKAREKIDWDLSKWFVVRGEDTKVFLQEKLSKMGLTPREYNEFIVYWFPLMQDNAYNLIHFAGEQYTETAPLTITPTPDSMLRVFMVWKALEEPIAIEEQNIELFQRTGFSVIERGGSEVF